MFYLYGIGGQYRACFDELPHYDRFVSLMPRLFVPLMVLLHGLSGEQTGVYFVDSTRIPQLVGPAGPNAAEMLAKPPASSFTRRVRQNSAT